MHRISIFLLPYGLKPKSITFKQNLHLYGFTVLDNVEVDTHTLITGQILTSTHTPNAAWLKINSFV